MAASFALDHQKDRWCPASGLALRPRATRCICEAAARSVTITVGVQPTTSALAYTTKKKSEPRPACHDLDRASRLDCQLVDGPLQFCTPALFLGGPGVPAGISARRHLDHLAAPTFRRPGHSRPGGELSNFTTSCQFSGRAHPSMSARGKFGLVAGTEEPRGIH